MHGALCTVQTRIDRSRLYVYQHLSPRVYCLFSLNKYSAGQEHRIGKQRSSPGEY